MESTSGSEYRRNPRVPVRRMARLELRDSAARTAVTRDVSRDRLSVMLDDCDLAPGALLSVSLPIAGATITLPGHIAWLRRGPDGLRLGLKLHPEICDGGTRRLFDGFVRSSERALFTGSELSRPF